MSPVINPVVTPKTLYFVRKRDPLDVKQMKRQALVIFNDGFRLYARHGELQTHLPYRMFKSAAPAALLPGANFIEPNVKFKTFGHTRDGGAIIILWERSNNWSTTLSVNRGHVLGLSDSYRSVWVTLLK